jgi:hypothetical protein
MLLKRSNRDPAIGLKGQQRSRDALYFAPTFLSPHNVFNLHKLASRWPTAAHRFLIAVSFAAISERL